MEQGLGGIVYAGEAALAAQKEGGPHELPHLRCVMGHARLPGAVEEGGLGQGTVGELARIFAALIAEVAIG
jgi:hypothetical protein